MLHGRVVRPPYAGFDSGALVGNSLIAVDEASFRGSLGWSLSSETAISSASSPTGRERGQRGGAAEGGLEAGAALPRSSGTPRRRCAPTRLNRESWSTAATSMPRSQGRPSQWSGPTFGPTRCTARSARPAPSPIIVTALTGSGRARKTRTSCAAIFQAARTPGRRHRRDPDGGRRLLRPQLRRRCLGRRSCCFRVPSAAPFAYN